MLRVLELAFVCFDLIRMRSFEFGNSLLPFVIGSSTVSQSFVKLALELPLSCRVLLSQILELSLMRSFDLICIKAGLLQGCGVLLSQLL